MIKEFTLGAVKWKVEINNKLTDENGIYGRCIPDSSKIILADNYRSVKRTKESVEETLYHEVVHAILSSLNYIDLYQDDLFVQQLAVLLYQFDKTKK